MTTETDSTTTAAIAPAEHRTKGKKHVSPPGRHSQQTHRRADERGAAEGHTTEKALHAHDRSVELAEQGDKVTKQEQQKREQAGRGNTAKP